ncbi:hypothetical protein HZB03_00745 [Candidatus Woesearchaeota archaeon]|nr:hypothetical protein [Candidatus Woesearchaeota archaeon]
MAEDKPQKMKKQEVFHKRNLTDFLAGAAIGAVFDLVLPYNDRESVENMLLDGILIGLPVSLPYGVMRGYYINKKEGIRAFTAMYAGSFVGQMFIRALQMYS